MAKKLCPTCLGEGFVPKEEAKSTPPEGNK